MFVVEADESDGSFLAFTPDVAVITNVEPDHLDHHGTEEAYRAVFEQFVDRIQPGGSLIVCADDPGVAPLVARARDRGLTVRCYGHAEPVRRRAARVHPGRCGRPAYGPGSAATRWCCGCRYPASTWRSTRWAPRWPPSRWARTATALTEGLAAFDGVRRRFEYKGRVGGVAVYDDYAHHPTEVAATLRAAREVRRAGGRVVVAFQPHLYSRTRTFADAFGAALGLADEVVVLDVYGAREDPEPGVSGALVADAVPLPADAGALRAAVVGGARRAGRVWPARATW